MKLLCSSTWLSYVVLSVRNRRSTSHVTGGVCCSHSISIRLKYRKRSSVRMCMSVWVMLCLPSANQCSWQRGCWDSGSIPNRKWNSDLEHKHTPSLFFSHTQQTNTHIRSFQICIQRYRNTQAYQYRRTGSHASLVPGVWIKFHKPVLTEFSISD